MPISTVVIDNITEKEGKIMDNTIDMESLFGCLEARDFDGADKIANGGGDGLDLEGICFECE